MDVVSIYVCPVGAFIAAFIFYWIMGPSFAREQIGLGRNGSIPAWIMPLGKYLYCGHSPAGAGARNNCSAA